MNRIMKEEKGERGQGGRVEAGDTKSQGRALDARNGKNEAERGMAMTITRNQKQLIKYQVGKKGRDEAGKGDLIEGFCALVGAEPCIFEARRRSLRSPRVLLGLHQSYNYPWEVLGSGARTGRRDGLRDKELGLSHLEWYFRCKDDATMINNE